MDADDPSNGGHSASFQPKDSEADPTSIRIPDHQLLRRIGGGAYGDVWLARNMMGMYRAVKIVHRASFNSQRPFDRELSGIRKFEPISRSYEGFVDVLHVGINAEQGYFYYVMELGDDETTGQTIDPANYLPKTLAKQIASNHRLPVQECLQLGLALTQALAELHKHKLVHRDVKPSNIIFVNGVPKLADIGLVADQNEARSYVGTEGYIPPEGPGTPQADIYSLGKVLYEASTGKDRQEFPELPTLLGEISDQGLLLELNEVILQACHNESKKRYQSAWDMHADLVVLANGKSVKRLKLLERRVASLKRLASISAVFAVVVAVICYEVYRNWRMMVKSRDDLVRGNIAQGNRQLEGGDVGSALGYFARAFELDEKRSEKEQAHRVRFGTTLAENPKIVQMWFLKEEIQDAEFDPTDQKVFIAHLSGEARVYDIGTGKPDDILFQTGRRLTRAKFSQDGTQVLTLSESDNAATIWDFKSGRPIAKLSRPSKIFSAAFSPDGRRVLIGYTDGTARLWEISTGEVVWEAPVHKETVRGVAFSHNGKLVATASRDSTVMLWEAATGRPVGVPLEHSSWAKHVAFSSDDQKLITSDFDNNASVWEAPSETNNQQARFLFEVHHSGGVECADFSPDGSMIVTASLDGTVKIWRMRGRHTPDVPLVLPHSARVLHASFSHDSRMIVTTCIDGTVRVWDLAGRIVVPPAVPWVYSADGSVAAGRSNRFVLLHEASSERAISSLREADRLPAKVELSATGRFAVVANTVLNTNSSAGTVLCVWHVTNAQPVGVELPVSNQPRRLLLSDDGRRVVALIGQTIRAWDVSTGSESASITHAGAAEAVCLSPDGKYVAFWGGKDVHLLNVVNGKEHTFSHELDAGVAVFRRDSLALATCCWNNQATPGYAQVWDLNGRPLGPKLWHTDGVRSAAFSPDGKSLATAGEDARVIIWNPKTGKYLGHPLNHAAQVRGVGFSPNGRWLVTASLDKAAQVWDIETGEPLTPKLAHHSSPVESMFLSDGLHVVTLDFLNFRRVWSLAKVDQPERDLVQIARLLSGSSVNVDDTPPAEQTEVLATTWQSLQTKYPAMFHTTDEDIATWHEYSVDVCQARKQWAGVIFHLEQLVRIRPNDPALQDRLTKARAQSLAGQ